MSNVRQIQPEQQFPIKYIIIGAVLVLIFMFGSKFIKTVDAGHVAVATLFGEVQTETFDEGLHIVNPLYKWHEYDIREKSHLEHIKVPSQDQLQTDIDVSIQFRLDGTKAAIMWKNTGEMQKLIDVQLIPKLRSVVREQGKTIEKAEHFFNKDTQGILEQALTEKLSNYLEPKGIIVLAVLVRNITLPAFITKAIEQKKVREQEVEKQKAELERFKTEQQQKIAQAEAERKAAEEFAKQKIILADAQAYEIEKINKAVGSNPSYIKLQSLEALKAISKDPASKIYFINSDSPQPLPLMHLSDLQK